MAQSHPQVSHLPAEHRGGGIEVGRTSVGTEPGSQRPCGARLPPGPGSGAPSSSLAPVGPTRESHRRRESPTKQSGVLSAMRNSGSKTGYEGRGGQGRGGVGGGRTKDQRAEGKEQGKQGWGWASPLQAPACLCALRPQPVISPPRPSRAGMAAPLQRDKHLGVPRLPRVDFEAPQMQQLASGPCVGSSRGAAALPVTGTTRC